MAHKNTGILSKIENGLPTQLKVREACLFMQETILNRRHTKVSQRKLFADVDAMRERFYKEVYAILGHVPRKSQSGIDYEIYKGQVTVLVGLQPMGSFKFSF